MVSSGWFKVSRTLVFITFLFALLVDPLAEIAQVRHSDVIACEVPFVVFTALVTDANGSSVTNLTRDNFIVTDRQRIVTIDYLSRGDDPLTITIVVPTAGHNDANYLNAVRDAIQSLKEKSNQKNRYSIVTDAAGSQFFRRLEAEGAVVMDTISLIEADSTAGTALDLCKVAQQNPPEELQSIILVIDPGVALSPLRSFSDLREHIRLSNVPIYYFSLTDARINEIVHGSLTRLSTITGGATFEISSSKELVADMSRLATDLRRRYVVGYYPPFRQQDGVWHRVRVRAFSTVDAVAEPTPLMVRTFTGYVAHSL